MRRLFYLACLSVLALGLSACDTKPPECASQDVQLTAQSALTEALGKAIAKAYGDPTGAFDPVDIELQQDEAQSFLKAVRVTLSQVAENGYDKAAHKYSCTAKLAVQTPTGARFERSNPYAVQRVSGDGNPFVVAIEDADAFMRPLLEDYQTVLEVKGLLAHYRDEKPASDCVRLRMFAWHKEMGDRQWTQRSEALKASRPFVPIELSLMDSARAAAIEDARRRCG